MTTTNPTSAERSVESVAAGLTSELRDALDEARVEERCKVVEWLREQDATRPGDNWLGWIAGRIEKGEHLKAQEKKG